MKEVSQDIINTVSRLQQLCEDERWNLNLYVTEPDQDKPNQRSKLENLFHFVSGLYFGYPICCILYFIRNKNKVYVGNYYGHVRCKKHQKVGDNGTN